MYFINKITSDSVIDYTAEELKKYLRMMLPNGNDIKIRYAPLATDGYRIGCFSDLGIALPEGRNAECDDCMYVDCDERGGIIAGANPRAALIAVYEYLRRNGCRWLFPGTEGEYIPRRMPAKTRFTLTPRMRIRGSCIECSAKQSMLIDFIDFMPKVGLNCFMLQYRIPSTFYRRYALHEDPFCRVDFEDGELDSLTRAIECEMAKRGILLHAYGHGLNNDPFGIDSTLSWNVVDEGVVPEDAREHLALTKGRRGLFMDRVATTQNCLSNPNTRKKIVDYTVSYIKAHSNIDGMHVWLADSVYNHCECAECAKRTVSDWYALLINEIDGEVRRLGLKSKVVFISYTETMHAPATEKINLSDNLIMMVAPIGRDYSVTEDAPGTTPPKEPYIRNGSKPPETLDEFMQYTRDWQRCFGGDSFIFEYHFWQCHAYDLSTLKLANRVYEDILYFERQGHSGIMECGSQRCFFPNGLAYYVHARATLDASLSLDDIVREYSECAYGDYARDVLDALRSLEEQIPFEYLNVTMAQRRESGYISREMKRRAEGLPRLIERIEELVEKHSEKAPRIRLVSLGLLHYYCTYLIGVGEVVKHIAVGETELALKEHDTLYCKMEKLAPILLPYFDFMQRLGTIKTICRTSHVEGFVDPTM